jgi:hypothetical protein
MRRTEERGEKEGIRREREEGEGGGEEEEEG